MRVSCRHWSVKIGAVFFIQERRTKMEKIRIEVDKVILYYMDRVDPYGNQEGQVFCDMITERIEKYEKRMSYDKGKLNN